MKLLASILLLISAVSIYAIEEKVEPIKISSGEQYFDMVNFLGDFSTLAKEGNIRAFARKNLELRLLEDDFLRNETSHPCTVLEGAEALVTAEYRPLGGKDGKSSLVADFVFGTKKTTEGELSCAVHAVITATDDHGNAELTLGYRSKTQIGEWNREVFAHLILEIVPLKMIKQ